MMMWTCVCGATNAPGLDNCPSCGNPRYSAVRPPDDSKSRENGQIGARRDNPAEALKILRAAGMGTLGDIAAGLRDGRVVTALKAWSGHESVAVTRYRELVDYLVAAGYPVAGYKYRMVSWKEVR